MAAPKGHVAPLSARQTLAAMSRVRSPRASTIPNKKRQANRLACRKQERS